MRKVVCIYHANCADGFGAAYAVWRMFHNVTQFEAIPAHYDEVFNIEQVRDCDVYIVDFSFPKDVMLAIMEVAHHTTWFDHHKTAFENWGCNENYYKSDSAKHRIVLDNNRSGAMITWQELYPNEVIPYPTRYIDDRDRWVFSMAHTKQFAAGLRDLQQWTFEQWDAIYNSDASVSGLIERGQLILELQDKDVAAAAKRAHKATVIWRDDAGEVHTCDGLMVNAANNISELGNVLAKKSGTYGLVWYMDATGVVRVSFRSIGDYDVSVIAKHFGGGGHKNAAGCTVAPFMVIAFMAV